MDTVKMTWSLWLENDEGQTGYFALFSDDGFSIANDVSEAHRFGTEEEAEAVLLKLEQAYGLKREEAEIRAVVEDKEFSVWLGEGEWPDGLGVQWDRRTGERLLLVRNGGMETTAAVPEEVGDHLISLLGKFRKKLRASKT